MKNKKAELNQVFVYIMSTILILFVGFLVTKFIMAFNSDSKDVIDKKFLSGLENDISQVASRYGSEEILEYKLNSEVTNICFISKSACADTNLISNSNLNIESDELNALSQTSNLLIFNKNGILFDSSLNQFNSDDNNGCFCIKPNNNRFELLIENRKNKVWISDYANQ